MLLSFFGSFVVASSVIFIPGLIGLAIAGQTFQFALLAGPAASIAVYELIAIAFSLCGVGLNAFSLIIVSCVVAAIVGILLRRCNKKHLSVWAKERQVGLALTVAAIVVSGLLAWLLFFRPLGYDTIIVGYDSVFHFNLIRSFLNTGDFSPLSVNLYKGCAVTPFGEDGVIGSFYPAAWHLLGALTSSLIPADLAITVNAVNLAFCSCVYAVGQSALVRTLLLEKTTRSHASLVLPLLCCAFPWILLLRGEQFPQLAAFSLLPTSCYLIHVAIRSRDFRTSNYICVLASVFSLVMLQSNVLFSLLIFFVFDYGQLRFSEKGSHQKNAVLKHFAISAAIWIALFVCPAFRGVVSYNWPATVSWQQAIFNILTMSFTSNNKIQALFAILIICGLFSLLSSRDKWLAGPYLFSCFAYLVSVSSEGLVKHLIAGFWYTDPDRLAAQVAIFSIPVAAAGFDYLFVRFAEGIKQKAKGVCSGANGKLLPVAFSIVVVCIVTTPNIWANGYGQISTAFGSLADSIAYLRSDSFEPILSNQEISFADRVKAITGTDALILNIPDDGSSLLYGLDNLNVMYKRGLTIKDDSTSDRSIRNRLDKLADDESVSQALQATGAKYILILDKDTSSGFFHTFQKKEWKGFYRLDSETKGVELLLHEDDCYLYKILN